MASAVLLALRARPSPASHLSRSLASPRIRTPLSSNLSIPLGNGAPLGRNGFLFKEKPKTPPFVCFYKSDDDQVSAGGWPVLGRWEVPWEWQTVLLTMLACGLRSTTVVVLGILFSITNKFQPLPDDILCYDLKRPFDLKNGWLLWAMVGLLCAVLAIYLTGAVLTVVNGEDPKRETDALIRLLPLIGSSSVRTAYLLGITGVLAPLLEETVFRGFLMVSLTKWVPTPVSVVLSAAAFSLAHLTPGEFPQLFVLGIMLGLSYAQTRNLLTPITIHALWNSGVIILLTFLQLQGYDIRELLQASS